MSIPYGIRALAGVVLAFGLVAPADAQDRLFIDGVEIGAHGRFGQPIGPANGLDGELAGGGRFLVPVTFKGETDVVDLHIGARRALPTGANVDSVDSARARLILSLPGTGHTGTLDVAVFDIVTGATDVVVTGACPSGLIGGAERVWHTRTDVQLVLVLRCTAPQVVQDLVAVDLSGPSHQVRVLPFTPKSSLLEVSSDGHRLFAGTSTGFGTGVIDAYDIATGAKVGTAAVLGQMHWDDAIDGLLVISGGGFADSNVSVFGRSMQPLGAAVSSSKVCPARVQVSAHTGRIYLTRNGASNTGAEPTVVEAFAGAPLQLVGRVTVSPLGQMSCRGAMVRTAPGPPRSLQATVNGRDVTVDWTNVGGASGFLLEVGLAAERTDLSIALGPNSQAAFANVPSGTYYLRVRGGNEFGGGRSSPEVQVVVP